MTNGDETGLGGATVVVPRTVVPDTGVFAIFTDPAGNLVGLGEPDEATS